MELSSLCVVLLASLVVDPNRSQFFRYERISMTCESQDSSDGWELRSTTDQSKPCDRGCVLVDVYPSDSGVYWCESRNGECSNRVNITVTDGTVILQVPALPVTAGDAVTLRCSHRERYSKNVSSAFFAVFYKDDVFIGAEPAGEMILPAVSMSDQGSYRCEHPQKGKSQQSWLSIRERMTSDPSPTPPPVFVSLPRLLCTIVLFFLYTALFTLCIYMYRRGTRGKNPSEDPRNTRTHHPPSSTWD